jgi:nucleotide-binding universal stress UspA family protein
MFRKILIPTDGSPISTEAAHAGIALAAQLGAETVGIFVAPEYQYPLYVEMVPPNFPTEAEYATMMRQVGESYLGEVRKAAEDAGLKFTGITVFSEATAQEIVNAAQQNGCDLISMGSHGRSGLGQLLLGSVTAKVLSMSQIPVLVYRAKPDGA